MGQNWGIFQSPGRHERSEQRLGCRVVLGLRHAPGGVGISADGDGKVLESTIGFVKLVIPM